MAISTENSHLNNCLTAPLDSDSSGGFIVMEPYPELRENYEDTNKISGLIYVVLGVLLVTVGIGCYLYFKKNKNNLNSWFIINKLVCFY